MSRLTDSLFANSDRSIYGKRYLCSTGGEPVVISKSIRYTISAGDSDVHMYTPEDVTEYCCRMQYQKASKNYKNNRRKQ